MTGLNIPRASIWPNVTFDTTDPEEMHQAQQWARSLLKQPSQTPLSAPESHEHTQSRGTGPQPPETDTQMPPPKPEHHESQIEPIGAPLHDQCQVYGPGGLLELQYAAQWARQELNK